MSIEYAHPTETVKKTITWDGNTEGKVAVSTEDNYVYKVSDTPIKVTSENITKLCWDTGEDIVKALGSIGEKPNVMSQTLATGVTMTVIGLIAESNAGGVSSAQYVMVADGDIEYGETSIEKGVYFLSTTEGRFIALLETEEEVIRNEVSSLSYQKAYPEYIEHLKNRKYDPPVTARTVKKTITWDGNTEGKYSIPFDGLNGLNFVQMSDEPFDFDKCVVKRAIMTTVDGSIEIETTTFDFTTLTHEDGTATFIEFIHPDGGDLCALSVSNTFAPEDVEWRKGTYLMSSADAYTKLLELETIH